MLWQRVLFGSLMIAAVVGITWLDAHLSSEAATLRQVGAVPLADLPLTLLLGTLTVMGAIEMGRVCRAGGHEPVTWWAAFVTAGLMLVPWFEMHAGTGRAGPLLAGAAEHASATIVWTTGGILGACLLVLARRTTERALANIAVTVLMFVYLGLLGSFLVRVRCLMPGPAGALLLVYAILVIKAGDIGAYFTGLMFGRTKLAPWLSPAKTVEGAAGAMVAAIGLAVAGMMVWAWLDPSGSVPFTLAQASIFGILMAVGGHLGDLVESAFKRDMKIKDSGHVLPSFGGFLDVLDSLLFAAPIAWIAMTSWA